MKLKYFLRGLGVGIIFSCVVFFTAYQSGAAGKMTDAQIMNRAKELGMVEKEDPLENLLPKQADAAKDRETSKDDNENTTLKDTDKNSEKDSTAETGEEKKEQTTEVTTQAQTKAVQTTTAEKKETVTIKIDGGSTSYTVCQKLHKAGLIENADEFDAYLVKNGYADRIRVGEYTLKKGMSFQDIAEAISEPR